VNEIDGKRLALSKTRQDEIRAEEIFRNEVQEQIATDKSSLNILQRIWNSRNSAFSLWFLSSVLIASLSWGYTQWETARIQQLQAETAFKDLSLNAAESFEVLNNAISTYRNRVDKYFDEELRKQARMTRLLSMMEVAARIENQSTKHNIEIEKFREMLSDADQKAGSFFSYWINFAQGADVEARTKWLEDYSKYRIEEKKDDKYIDVLAWKTSKPFMFVSDAIRIKVLSEQYSKDLELLAEVVTQRAAEIKFSASDFSPFPGPETWIEEDSVIKIKISKYDFGLQPMWNQVFNAYRLGIYQSSFDFAQIMQKNLSPGESKVMKGLIQYELAHKKHLQALSEMEAARLNFHNDTKLMLLDAIDTAKILDRTVLTEAEQLGSGEWNRGISNIPGLSENLRRRAERVLNARNEIPAEVKKFEEEAINDIAESQAHLERLLLTQ
jgi:hypothetical protein